MAAITDQEFETIQNLCQESEELFTAAAARLYSSENDQWNYTGIWGPAVLLQDSTSFHIKVFSLETNRVVFQQEMYFNFEYTKQKPWFHSFEADEVVYGLSFADDGSADDFYNQVHIAINEQGGNDAGAAAVADEEEEEVYQPPAQPAYHAPAAQPAYQPPAQPAHQQPAPVSTPPPINNPPPTSSPQMAPPTGHVAPPSNSQLTMKLVPIQADKSEKKEDPKKKKSGGFFSKFRSNKKKPQEMEITGPTSFKHESHIGWDLENGFDIRNIPPEWKKLFQAAGVKKSDLEDPETRKMLASTVGQMLGGTDSETMHAAVAAPPPPPPPGAGGPPPPPPPAAGPPPAAAFAAGPSAPPPPPAGGPPPASAAPAAANSLQAALAAKRGALTKVDEVPAHHAPPPTSSAAAAPSLVDTLAAAMAKRRVEIDKNDEDDDGWSDEDWSE